MKKTSEIEGDIVFPKVTFTPPNSFCTSIVVPYMQELDKHFSKRFLSKSLFVMKLPIDFKGIQVLEWNVCKRLIFYPNIDLTPFYGGGEI